VDDKRVEREVNYRLPSFDRQQVDLPVGLTELAEIGIVRRQSDRSIGQHCRAVKHFRRVLERMVRNRPDQKQEQIDGHRNAAEVSILFE
jgi:hypothetical protein